MSPLKIKKGASRKSAYDLKDPNADIIETHTLAVVVDNEAGVLARVIGLFSGRGYNIESLTVAEIEPAVKGQTAANSFKPAVLDNGIRIMVPPFIDQGQAIVVSTESMEYSERA